MYVLPPRARGLGAPMRSTAALPPEAPLGRRPLSSPLVPVENTVLFRLSARVVGSEREWTRASETDETGIIARPIGGLGYGRREPGFILSLVAHPEARMQCDRHRESNPVPSAPKPNALPIELPSHQPVGGATDSA